MSKLISFRALGSLLPGILSSRSEATTIPQLRQGILGIAPQAGKRSRANGHGKSLSGDGPVAGVLADPAPHRRAFAASLATACVRVGQRLFLSVQSLLRSLRSILANFLASRSEKSTLSQFRGTQRTLGIGQQAGEHTRDTHQRKNPLGDGPAAASFTVLADPPPRHRAFTASFAIECIGVMLLMALPILLPEKLNPIRRYEVVPLVAPPTTLPLTPPKLQARAPSPIERVERPKVAKLMAPPRPVFQATKFEAPKPAHPRPGVRTGALSAVSFAPPTIRKNAAHVQTGGFGDTNGLPGPGNPNKRANIAQRGSSGLPVGAGFGNGLGGATGVPGTVAKGGGEAAPANEPVEILSKPQPVYTAEARRQRLEGEVLVQVIFRASGEMKVIRVVRGLGHGLDESAVSAAQQIRFKPARRQGKPIDFPAVIHIVFQMAY